MPYVKGQKSSNPGGKPKVGARQRKLKPLDLVIAELEVKLGVVVEPCEILLSIGAGTDPSDPKRAVPVALRMEACKHMSRFIRPQLANIEVTGAGGGPIATANLPIEKLMANPEVASALEDLIIGQAANIRADNETQESQPDGADPQGDA